MEDYSEIKKDVLQRCSAAGISNRPFLANLLKFYRRVNTCRNMLLRGTTWEAMCWSEPYRQASDAIDLMNGSGCLQGDDVIYADDYRKYCRATGMCYDATLGDWLA